MFERFNEPARMTMTLAQEEARLLRHGHIGTEHLLLALLELEDGGGPLAGLGIDKARAESDIAARLAAMEQKPEEGAGDGG